MEGSKSGSFIGSLLSMGLQPVDGGLIEAELLKNGLYITGRYRNDLVFVRAVMMIKQMEMKEEELLILRKVPVHVSATKTNISFGIIQIFETNHENLNRFVGICMDSRKDILIVWNHCGKGKLKVVQIVTKKNTKCVANNVDCRIYCMTRTLG